MSSSSLSLRAATAAFSSSEKKSSSRNSSGSQNSSPRSEHSVDISSTLEPAAKSPTEIHRRPSKPRLAAGQQPLLDAEKRRGEERAAGLHPPERSGTAEKEMKGKERREAEWNVDGRRGF